MNKPQNDYLKLVERYQQLDNGQKAMLRRATSPDDMTGIAAFYQLISATKFQLKQDEKQAAQLVYFLPWVQQRANGKPLGRSLHEHGISEKRLFLVVRRESPDDLIQLRRVVQQIKPIAYADWSDLGNLLFYWGKKNKHQLMRDFYISASPHLQEPPED
ncbi:type I-E CRISPR-associated protein Cse2/CasB [Methylobacter tundripaludum]|uniref:CRISPR-associated protein, Cse2 family n=1 Tax=Methylobacter tundripaludum (strain ATCC BAA-1195 / DSM 17260 / SV96) TaxID=697282 RepID=G3IX76_METTV|nr:type I-E CRISPR-associated protein Cse2/CasB [Methylobacter tundripaludum]EGW22013.1 CRISPR-associated protein, Cse2 family [Methylobacter tundripaludum SV96]